MPRHNSPRDIATFLTPGDVLALARVNKLLRELLMQRSSRHIWRAAERSVDRLPPCPRHLTNPQYAALVFSKECSSCGITVMRKLDHILGVRLCNACRSAKVVRLHYAPSALREYVPTSSVVKNPRISETRFALKSEIHELVDQFWDLPNDFEHPTVLRWVHKKLRRRLERTKHATALARYTHLTSISRDQELEGKKVDRGIEIRSRLRALGWKEEQIRMAYEDSRKAWCSLVRTPKPLTDRAWERLYPKLLRLLKRSKRQLQTRRAKVRLSERYKLVEELLAEMRAAQSVPLEMAENGPKLFNHPSPANIPFPALSELLQYHVFKDLVKTDRPLDAIKAKFRASADLVNNAISKWRTRLEAHLIGLVNDGRNIRKRGCLMGDELVEETATFSSQLTAASYKQITPRNSILLRADSVFSYNENILALYPRNFTSRFDGEFMVERPPGLDGPILDLLFSKVKYHNKGARYAAALLKQLGRPDASHIEMEALGERFVCSRCTDCTIHTWTSLISHVLHAYSCSVSIDSRFIHRAGDAYHNVHDWHIWPERPLARLLDDRELEINNPMTPYVIGRMVECRICHDLASSYSSTRKSTMLHLRYYHSILQPIFGEHYFEVSDKCSESGPGNQTLEIDLPHLE